MKFTTILFLIFISTELVYSQLTISDTIMHDSLQRDYIIYLPENYTSSKTYPVIFNFHGFFQNNLIQLEYSDFRPIADTAEIILVYPQGTLYYFDWFFGWVPHWNVNGYWHLYSSTDDIGFIDALIDSIALEYPIDLSRIYATGFSNGGYFSHHLACLLSHRIAAIASVSGSMTPYTYENCNPEHPTPVLQIHGTKDGTVPFYGKPGSVSVDSVIELWTNFNHNNLDFTLTTEIFEQNEFEIDTIEHYAFQEGDNDVNVELYKLFGGKHRWFEYDEPVEFSSNIKIWEFFSRYDINGYNPLKVVNPGNESKIKMFVYPNPTSGILNIKNAKNQQLAYMLFTMTGKKLISGTIHSSENYLNISQLSQGMYILNINNKNFKVFKTK